MALQLGTLVAASLSDDAASPTCEIRSMKYEDDVVSFSIDSDIAPVEPPSSWHNYVLGPVALFCKEFPQKRGFKALIGEVGLFFSSEK